MIKKILVSQPKPSSEKSPYYDIASKFGVELVFRPFIKVEGITAKEFRAQKVAILDYTAVVFTSRHAIDNYFTLAKEMRQAHFLRDRAGFCRTDLRVSARACGAADRKAHRQMARKADRKASAAEIAAARTELISGRAGVCRLDRAAGHRDLFAGRGRRIPCARPAAAVLRSHHGAHRKNLFIEQQYCTVPHAAERKILRVRARHGAGRYHGHYPADSLGCRIRRGGHARFSL